MKKNITLILSLFMLCLPVSAQLRFAADGSFKIACFTDLHFNYSSEQKKTWSAGAMERLESIVASEKPDLIMITGDVVTSAPATTVWKEFLARMDKLSVPYCICLGNHDAEAGISRTQLADLICSGKGCLCIRNGSGEIADQSFPILASKENTPAFYIYSMDSHDYSRIKPVEGYGWFSAAQVEWFRNESNGRTAPSFVFYHIPLPQYQICGTKQELGYIGRMAEDVCPQGLDSGMFEAMVRSGSVIGSFCGHDHDNDFLYLRNGIVLGYNRFSGSDTIYNNLIPGSRIIIIKEGEKYFKTYIREGSGRIADKSVFEEGVLREL